ncbi:MAG: hypothetical protein ACR2N2_01730 [Acidimicrobiia bacterium]
MKPSHGSAFGIGALVGLVLSTCAMLYFGASGGVPKLDVAGEGASIEPIFAVPASAMWTTTIVGGAICGLILAIATKAIARVIDPETSGASLWIIAPAGAIVGGVVAFAVFPLGVSLLGELKDGTAAVAVSDLVLLASLAGLAGGAIVTWQSYILARPPVHADDEELLQAPEPAAS